MKSVHLLDEGTASIDEIPSMAKVAAQDQEVGVRPEAAEQQAIRVQLLQPLAVENIGLAARNSPDVLSVDEKDLDAALFEQIVPRNPIHAGGLHRHRGHAARLKPVGQLVQPAGESAEFANGLVVAIRRNRHEM